MNTYKIIFTRENGTQGTDHFTAINERQARKDFGECYRHSTATIISIELASTNTPATKQQERDTLEKIRKMVEQLGPDSYLATAFEGCFDLAAENIDNDWACSMADRARNAEKRVAELEDNAVRGREGLRGRPCCRPCGRRGKGRRDCKAEGSAEADPGDRPLEWPEMRRGSDRRWRGPAPC